MNTRRITVELLALLLIFIVCVQLGFYELFSNYREYDDEGLFMLSNKLYLDGYIPYSEITWIFGPLQLAVVKFVHGWCEIPISNSSVRFLTLAHWLLLACVGYWLVRRVTGSWLWSASAFLLIFLYPRSLVNEPGHPQVLVAILALLIPLIGCWYDARGGRLPWVVLGAVAAAIINVKINAGAFCVAAVLVVLLSPSRLKAKFYPLCAIVVVASMLLPVLLMYPLISIENCLYFAIIVGFSTASFALVVSFKSQAGELLNHNVVALVTGFTAVSLFALGFAAAEGASPLDILLSLMRLSNSQVEFFHFFRDYSLAQVFVAGLSLVMALVAVTVRNSTVVGWILWFSRGIFLVGVIYALVIDGPANSQALIAYATPWCWVAAFKTSNDAVPLGRMLLVAIAVWMPLLAYPIPGTQLYFGGLFVLTASIVCAADASAVLNARFHGSSIFLREKLLPVSLVVAVTTLLLSLHGTAKKQYANYQPLRLAGTEFIRIEPGRAKLYRELVQSLNGADVVLTNSRFNSLYFWTGAHVPSPGFLSQYPLRHATPEQQQWGKAGVLNALRPMLVIKKSGLVESDPDGTNWIELHFEISEEIGPYTVMKKRLTVSDSTQRLRY